MTRPQLGPRLGGGESKEAETRGCCCSPAEPLAATADVCTRALRVPRTACRLRVEGGAAVRQVAGGACETRGAMRRRAQLPAATVRRSGARSVSSWLFTPPRAVWDGIIGSSHRPAVRIVAPSIADVLRPTACGESIRT